MTSKKVTIKDVAREAGVSIATVSRFLNHNYASMSKDTRERITQIVDQLNYHPNKLAQGLKGQSRTVAVVVVNISYPFCVSVIRSISDVLEAHGYSLLVCETGGDADRENTMIRSLIAQGVDGIILQTNGANNDLLQTYAKDMPIVLVDRQFDLPGVKNVITNNFDASLELTQALFKEGYERVLFISETLQGLSTRTERHDGYLQACEEYNSDPLVCWVDRRDPSSLHSVREAAAQLPAPSAVYTANGLLMLDLYPLLRELPLQVPHELGLATFDEPDWVRITQPTLTCVHQPTQEIGQLAANTVMDQLRGDIKPHLQPAINVLPSHLVWSASTLRT